MWKKIFMSLLMVSLSFVSVFSIAVRVDAKTIKVKETTNSCKKGKYIYYTPPGSIFAVEPDIFRYNIKTKKNEMLKKSDNYHKSYSSLKVKGKNLYAIVLFDGGTANAMCALIKIDLKTKQVKNIDYTYDYYLKGNKIYYEKFKIVKSQEFGKTMEGTGKWYVYLIKSGKVKTIKKPKFKVKKLSGNWDKVKINNSWYSIKNNEIFKNKKVIFNAEKSINGVRFECAGNYLIVHCSMKNYSQKYNMKTYIVKNNGKHKKLVRKWFDQ